MASPSKRQIMDKYLDNISTDDDSVVGESDAQLSVAGEDSSVDTYTDLASIFEIPNTTILDASETNPKVTKR